MRPLWKDVVLAYVLGMLLPGILVNGTVLYVEQKPEPMEQTFPEESTWTVRLRGGEGTVTEMDGERYVAGVVLAEMPASFDPEALKAQSVAARTYARKAQLTGGKHGDGSICTESSCCQAYVEEALYQLEGGTQESIDKVCAAVDSTAGLVLTYGGELIEATYFSSSGGTTEDAAAVWGMDYPYLQSVQSPGETGGGVYDQTLTFTPEEFSEDLGRSLSGDPRYWITLTTYTQGGGVAEMSICGEIYSGTQLRRLLGLRSTFFTVEATREKISVTTKGYGHRVGMSQYGAEAMATEGCSFRRILAHYYPGTTLESLQPSAPE